MEKEKLIKEIQQITGLLIFSSIIKKEVSSEDLRLNLNTLNSLLADLFIKISKENGELHSIRKHNSHSTGHYYEQCECSIGKDHDESE